MKIAYKSAVQLQGMLLTNLTGVFRQGLVEEDVHKTVPEFQEADSNSKSCEDSYSKGSNESRGRQESAVHLG